MKALVLDGAREDDRRTRAVAEAALAALTRRGYDVEAVSLRDKRIGACRGCFGCWTRTPGECVIADDAGEIVASWIRADVCAYVTPVTFGGYSAGLKSMVDRIIPVLDPRFMVVQGEVHHRLRYDRYPTIVALGTLPESDPEAERTFKTLVERNGLNTHKRAFAAVACGAQAPDPVVERLLAEAEVAA